MAWIIFFVYLILFCWIITVIPFFKKSGLSKKALCILFIIKIVAGIAYFQFYSLPANKPISDTWKFYNRSIAETDLLIHNPVSFFKGVVISKYGSTGELFSDTNSYWNDIKDELMVKLMAVANVFTFKNYYANIILFNFLFFFGLIAFYRLLIKPGKTAKWLLILSIFLIPSFLFWCSGIHKDGLIFSAIGLLLFCFPQLLNKQKAVSNLIAILLLLLLIFMLRNYLAFVLIPCLLIGWIMNLFPKRKLIILLSVVVLGTAFIFSGKYIHPSLNVPAYIASKQAQFRKLQGTSEISTKSIEPNFNSFISALPKAIDIGFFRPHITEAGLSSKIASIEIICFWIIFLIAILKSQKQDFKSPLLWTCWLFAFTSLLIIGYTVIFSGAVVRYRSLFLPLILAPVVQNLLLNHSYYKK